MPIQWTISHPHRLVVAICRDEVGRTDIEDYLDAVVVAETLPYRKIFDMTNAVMTLSDDDMMALGARIRAYAGLANMGPLALVATSPKSFERAQLFAVLADARRPLKIFSELHTARQWLDAQAPVKP